MGLSVLYGHLRKYNAINGNTNALRGVMDNWTYRSSLSLLPFHGQAMRHNF